MFNFLQFFLQDEVFSMSYPLFFSLIAIIFVVLLYGRFGSLSTSKRKLVLPPSPLKFPIIGNLHKIGSYPHRSLCALAQHYGPLMLLHFGRRPVLVVSSADAAREIMKTHDLIFSDRRKSSTTQKLLYDCKGVSTAPYGEYWRQIKSICVLHLLSNKRIQSYRAIREEELVLAMDKIKKSSSSALPVNLNEIFSTLTNDIICRVALGRKYCEGEDAEKFKKVFKEFTELLGGVYVGDFIPWLAWIGQINGRDARLDRVAKEFDSFLDGVVEDHMNRYEKGCHDHDISGIEAEDQKDFVDVLLEIQREETIGFAIDRVSIKAIMLDMFAAGTDTTYTVLEWAMTELLRHPKVMKELKEEIRHVAGDKSDVSDDELLKSCDQRDSSFTSPNSIISTQNVYQRDPMYWERPEEFFPERFLNNSIDFKGHHLELIPFGSGRRICPGIQFAMKINELVLANLIHKFDWSLPGGANEKDLDMSETSGLTTHRKSPLIAIGTPCFCQ